MPRSKNRGRPSAPKRGSDSASRAAAQALGPFARRAERLGWIAASVVLVLTLLTGLAPSAGESEATPTPPAPPAPSPGSGQAAATSPSPPRSSVFRDVTLEAGIDFVHDNGGSPLRQLHEIMGGGGAFLDFDGDGRLDLFFVQGGALGEGGAVDKALTSRLYRNEGDGSFRDVTAGSGAGVPGHGMGAAAMDYDRDGDVDIYLTRVGQDLMLRNEGDGRFSDVTAALGLGDREYASSAAWLDIDQDGWPDLYVARYIDYRPGSVDTCTGPTGRVDFCNPTAYPVPRHLLYRNLEGRRFEDVSLAAGVAGREGYGLAVAASDFDSDGLVDLYVANDQSPALLWRNQGGGRFRDEALRAGCAYDGDGVAIAGMGIVAEDFDGDADLDLFVTNIRLHANLFLENRGRSFQDVSARWGRADWLLPYTGFGVAALDVENDGRLELFVANGAVMQQASPLDPTRPYAEPNQFLRADDSGRLLDAASELDPSVLAPAVSRGLAQGDYDDDGDVDLLVLRNGERPQLLRNERGGGTWLTVSTQDAEGLGPVLNARVTVAFGASSLVREVRPHESYLTTGDPRVHFGLGGAERVDRLVVRWPDGSSESFGPVEANQFFTARRGSGQPGPDR